MIGPDKETITRFRQAVRKLVSEKLKDGTSIEDTLAALAEKWNPLFDPKARRDFLTDVNALVRDFLRPIRTSLQMGRLDRQTLDAKRLDALAEQVATSQALAKIAKREPLRRYVQLYILKCLGEV